MTSRISQSRVPLALSARCRRADGRIRDVEKPVDDNSGDRNVKPQGERPAGNRAMAGKLSPKASRQGDEYERNDHDGENRVRGQQREINRPNPALPSESNDSRVRVEVKITTEKYCRATKRGHHAEPMPENLFLPDQEIAGKQKYRAGSVERSIYSWKRGERNFHEIFG